MSWLSWQIMGVGLVTVWLFVWARCFLGLRRRLDRRSAPSVHSKQVAFAGLLATGLVAMLVGLAAMVMLHGVLLDGTLAD